MTKQLTKRFTVREVEALEKRCSIGVAHLWKFMEIILTEAVFREGYRFHPYYYQDSELSEMTGP